VSLDYSDIRGVITQGGGIVTTVTVLIAMSVWYARIFIRFTYLSFSIDWEQKTMNMSNMTYSPKKIGMMSYFFT
jgi:hypothetical protein